MLHGERAMFMREAQQMAKLLDLPLADVLRHAGLDIETAKEPQTVTIEVDPGGGQVTVYLSDDDDAAPVAVRKVGRGVLKIEFRKGKK